MKRYSLVLILILSLSMFLPMVPLASTDNTHDRVKSENLTESNVLASTPSVDGSIIKVSDDAGVIDGMPDSNFGGATGDGGIYAGRDVISNIGRSWLKFNLTHLPTNVHFSRATLNLYLVIEFGSEDYPVGVYYSENDDWIEDDITWNNQPEFDATPASILDSPTSPDMFVVGSWYEWEITAEVIQTLEEDGFLSLLLKQVEESHLNNTAQGFAARDYAVSLELNVIPYIALEYNEPVTSNLAVDGFDESPQIDYIQNANPEFGWSFGDADQDDFQRNYEIEVWNNTYFNESALMLERNSYYHVVHDTSDVGSGNPRPLATDDEIRHQAKWPASLIDQSGVVDKLFFEMTDVSGETTYHNLQVYMVCVEDSDTLGANLQTNYDGRTPILVLNRTSYTAGFENGFMVFDIENTFIVQEHLNLIIEIRHTGLSGTGGWWNQTNSGGSTSYVFGNVGDYSDNNADYAYLYTYGLRLELASLDVQSINGGFNSYPFNLAPGTSGRFQMKYNQSLIGESGTIDRILFPVNGFSNVTYTNFSIYLCETPVKGRLDHVDMDSNYGGVSPTLVIDKDEYTVINTGRVLVLDIDDTFYYSNTNDLLIDIHFDRLDKQGASVHYSSNVGGYRAWSYASPNNDTVGYDMYLDLIYDTNTFEYYSCFPLVNETTYFWRVRTCDSFGLWSPWETGSFTYEVLESEPDWTDLFVTPDPLEFGDTITASIDVTHTTEIKQVLIEYDGTNHTMIGAVDTYSHSWTPDSVGIIPYTIFMEAYSGVWGTHANDFIVEDTTPPEWDTTPVDQTLGYGEDLTYQLNATDLSGIANWTIDDAANFNVTDGLVTNIGVLAPGAYELNVTVTDNEGNNLSGVFTVTVQESTITTTTTTSTEPTDTGTTTPPPLDSTLIIIIVAAVAGVVVIIIIIMMKKK